MLLLLYCLYYLLQEADPRNPKVAAEFCVWEIVFHHAAADKTEE